MTTEPPTTPASDPSNPWRLPLALGALLVGVILISYWANGARQGPSPEGPVPDTQESVELTRRMPDVPDETLAVPLLAGMTVQEATLMAGGADESWRSVWRGNREMAFMTELGGVSNEGTEGLNWLFSVNGVRSEQGAGAVQLEPGDRVLWELAEYQ